MIVIRNRRLRQTLCRTLPLIWIPVSVAAGALFWRGKHYLLLSFWVAFLSLLLFFVGFERKKTGTRKLALASVLTAVCVVSRFIPVFKPMAALVTLSALYLGGETGFLIGAMTALLSNIYFGQGPWTPFQMLAMGLIGFAAGLVARILRRSRICLLIYGGLAGIAYSMIMDVWTTLWIDGSFATDLYRSALRSAMPFTFLYALTNVIFLLLLAPAFERRMGRICRKYALNESD